MMIQNEGIIQGQDNTIEFSISEQLKENFFKNLKGKILCSTQSFMCWNWFKWNSETEMSFIIIFIVNTYSHHIFDLIFVKKKKEKKHISILLLFICFMYCLHQEHHQQCLTVVFFKVEINSFLPNRHMLDWIRQKTTSLLSEVVSTKWRSDQQKESEKKLK